MQTRVIKLSKVTPDADNVDPRQKLRDAEFVALVSKILKERLRLQDTDFVTLASKILKEHLRLQDAKFATFASRDLKRADLKFSKS